jgi:PKD domain
MRVLCARIGAVLIGLLVAFLMVSTALATSNTVIGFDDLSPSAIVTNQYQAQGVVFGTSAGVGAPFSPATGDCGSPTVQNAVPAFSPTNYAQLATCSPPGGGVVNYAGTFGKFTNYPRGSFSVEVLLTSTFASIPVTINGYDTSGTLVASGSGMANDATWTKIVATQKSGGPVPAQISYFGITTSGSPNLPPLAIDDLSFDQAGAPLSATGNPISAQAGSPFSGTVATISDGDSTAVASDYTATINWGDGSSATGTISAGGGAGQFTVSGSHTWASGGSYPVHVAITKVNGRTTSADTTATVGGGSVGGGGGGGGGGFSSPTASVTLMTPNPTAGGLVTFSGANSTPGSGRIVSYDWGFDNPNTTTSTGTNPTAHWIFKPGFHTVTLTVTNSSGQKSTSKFGVNLGIQVQPFVPDGGQGDCQPTYDDGSVHIIADCIQTLSGGGYVIETKYLNLNGMVLAAKPGSSIGVYKIFPFNHLGIGSGTDLSGPAVNVELLNTPIGDVVIGGRDLTADPIQLTFTAFRPPTIIKFAGDHGPRARVADDNNKTLLMSLGVGKNCTAGTKDPTCCPPSSGTTACATLPGGFPLTGMVQVYLNNKGQSLFDVQVGLDLSAVNFEATGALEIEADPVNGINLNSLQFSIPEAGLANIFQVKNASFVYYFPSDPDQSKADTWQAKATIIFGPLSQPSLQGELDFKHGQFQKASLLFTAPSGTGVPIYPGILINQIGATVGVNPLEFGGQLGASIATQLELSLAFLYSDATDTQLGFFGGQGKLSFQGDDIATLAADVYSDGYTDAAIDIDLHFPFSSDDPVVSVKGHIGFWDEPSSGRWEADGSVALKLWVISAEVAGLVNDKQVAGCADVDGFGVQGHYDFSDGGIGGGFFGFSNCDDQLKQYKEKPVNPHTGGFVSSARDAARALTAADTRGGGTIRLPGGTDGQEVLINSDSGTPVVTIYAPTHQAYTTPSAPGQITTSGGDFISAIAPNTHQVIVFLRHPRGGLYNIQPTATSAPISSVAAAQDVPPASIRIHVAHRRGRSWSLKYSVKNYVAGTQVQFVERGRDSTHVLGTARSAHGTIVFTPQDAIGRSRTIFAYLQTSSGGPLRTMSVGRYFAPPALRPGRIAHARFSRRGTTAVLSWTTAPGTRQYRAVVFGSDGRVVTFFTTRRTVVLGQVLPTDRFTATVTPLGEPNMLPGRGVRATLGAASTGLVELLRCAKGTCSGQVVDGTLVLSGGEIHASLTRSGGVSASGIAADGTPSQLSVTVRRALAPGRYGTKLTARGRSIHRTITIR